MHIFGVVCRCGPMINLSRSLAIFCKEGWYVGVSEAVGMSFDVNYLFVVVYGCGPMKL